jgi:phenylalanyl-tRNA synthetase beta chain
LKVTLDWIKDYIDIDLSADEVAHKLTMAGLEVEAVYPVPRPFTRVVVGKIVEFEPIAKSNKLTYCQVDTGSGIVPVVCGAPNVRTGMKAPLALPGATLGDQFTVEKRAIFDHDSEGMLCSEAELGLSNRAAGLMDIDDDDVTPGTPLDEWLGESDTVLDIFITPNRPDCMSVIGIARELSALTGLPLKTPDTHFKTITDAIDTYISVEIRDPDLCPRYSGRMIKSVTIGPSPYWMVKRLHAVDIRSINNVVDITNYVLMETGHPLHAFDYRFLNNHKIIVQRAEAGETFMTLDDQDRPLTAETLMICDASKPVALAGVMGGQNSEVQEDTSSVFLESAYFDPPNIRKTSKRLELMTESSRRFERGADPNGTVFAMDRAAALMAEYADAVILSEYVDEYPETIESNTLQLRQQSVSRILGHDLDLETIERLLTPLEIERIQKNQDTLTVSIPTFRPDLEREVDLIEEIARLYGFDNLNSEIAPKVDLTQFANEKDEFTDTLRRLMVGLGFYETCSLSLVHKDLAQPFLPEQTGFVHLLNPLSADLEVFRPNMLYSLVNNVSYNRNRQIADMAFFEIGNVAWLPEGEKTPVERTQLAVILAGNRRNKTWYQNEESLDFYDIKGIYEQVFSTIGIQNATIEPAAGGVFDPMSITVSIDGSLAGCVGKLSDTVCQRFKIKHNDLFGFYFDVSMLYENRQKAPVYEPVPRYPSVPFDLALIVDANIPVGELHKGILESAGPYLKGISLFDLYRGEQVKAETKSVAFSLTFSSKERTLDETEIDAVISNILEHLKTQYGAELRPR